MEKLTRGRELARAVSRASIIKCPQLELALSLTHTTEAVSLRKRAMGEDAKQPSEEKKAEEKPAGDAPPAEEAPPPPPPPEEIEMRVFMHCEGCARKVRRCLKGFDGVEDVSTDCRSHKVVVKGKKAAEDPLKVVDRVQKKTGRKVELLSPLTPPPPAPKEEEKVEEKKEEEKPKVEEIKKEEPVVIVVVLKVHMHCEACAQEIKKRIVKMKGVESAESDLKASQVTVKGVFEPAQLVEYLYKRTGKHVSIVKTEAEKKAEEEKKKPEVGEKKPEEEKKAAEEEEEKKKAEGEKAEEKKEGGGDEKAPKKEAAAGEEAAAAAIKMEQKKITEFCYYYPRYAMENAYPPQIFSDENPNACCVM